ncbi:MAG TPA: peptide deformylase, partial [Desulfuromonadaceae bacterium]
MIRTILTYPDPELKKKSAAVTIITEATRDLVRDMAETMYDAPGVGLAAPQIGIHQRIIVIDVSGRDEQPDLIVAINPAIIHAEGETYEEEGCLSVPQYAANVRRHARVVVKGLD